jgi:hypothetical protein
MTTLQGQAYMTFDPNAHMTFDPKVHTTYDPKARKAKVTPIGEGGKFKFDLPILVSFCNSLNIMHIL